MGKTVITNTCPHRICAKIQYLSNDGVSPPVLWVENLNGPAAISLTNQTVRVSCGPCFEEIRRGLRHLLTKNGDLVK